VPVTGQSTEIVGDDDAGLARAAELLRAGEVVAMPTETVYGLAANACDAGAVARIYAAKGRPTFNPLIAHVSGLEMAARHVALPPLAQRLAEAFWPGPLTLVLPKRAESPVAAIVTAGLPTLAVRHPDHPVPQALIAELGFPLAAPSANRSGSISPTRASHVMKSLGGRIPLIVDAGPCRTGLESTIVAVDGERLRLLRPGGVPVEALAAYAEIVEAAPGSVEAPGMLESHYAPAKPLRLNAAAAAAGEYMIGFGDLGGDTTLSASGDLTEAAARLFEALHEADSSGASAIAVAPIPERGLGRAINDRLRRASVRS
jgi:L-threonylcarbamoyladenylate synthase